LPLDRGQELKRAGKRSQQDVWIALIQIGGQKSAQIMSRQQPRDLSVPSIKAAVSSACSITGIRLLYSLK